MLQPPLLEEVEGGGGQGAVAATLYLLFSDAYKLIALLYTGRVVDATLC